jgi:hypothetical protein
MSIEDAVHLVQLEYAEMPDLRITFGEACTLWEFSSELCDRTLTVLMRDGFLMRTADGRFVRRDHATDFAEARVRGAEA